jgi:hypothetical protein
VEARQQHQSVPTAAAWRRASTSIRMPESRRTRNQGHGATAHQDAFLGWCDDQVRPNLRNYFASTEELHTELDSSYDRIAFAPQMSERRMNSLTHRGLRTYLAAGGSATCARSCCM